jgi:hypothetical protein
MRKGSERLSKEQRETLIMIYRGGERRAAADLAEKWGVARSYPATMTHQLKRATNSRRWNDPRWKRAMEIGKILTP